MRVWFPSPMKCSMCRFYACYDELPFCRRCLPKLHLLLTEKCGSCGKTAQQCECGGNVRCMFFFNSRDSRKLIYYIKRNVDGRTMDFIAEMLIKVCGIKPRAYDGVTYVPRLKRNIRRYGHDQSKELAKSVSKIYGIPLVHALERAGGQDQKLLSRAERIKNIQGRYRVINAPAEKYKRLLLVDDVITTGATVSACADILRKSVAGSVTVLALAKTVTKSNREI